MIDVGFLYLEVEFQAPTFAHLGLTLPAKMRILDL
jgi:hypothetical protein